MPESPGLAWRRGAPPGSPTECVRSPFPPGGNPRFIIAQGIYICDTGNIHCFPVYHRSRGPAGLRGAVRSLEDGGGFALCAFGFPSSSFSSFVRKLPLGPSGSLFPALCLCACWLCSSVEREDFIKYGRMKWLCQVQSRAPLR